MASSAIMAMLDTFDAEDNPRNAMRREPTNARGFTRGNAADERKRILDNRAECTLGPMTADKWTSLKDGNGVFRTPDFKQTTPPIRNEVYLVRGSQNQTYREDVMWGPRGEEWWYNRCQPGEMKPRSSENEKEIEEAEAKARKKAEAEYGCGETYEAPPRMSILRRVKTYASMAPSAAASAAASAYGSVRTNVSAEQRVALGEGKPAQRERGKSFRTLKRMYNKYRVAPRRLPRNSEVLTRGQRFHQKYLMHYEPEHQGFKVKGGFSVP